MSDRGINGYPLREGLFFNEGKLKTIETKDVDASEKNIEEDTDIEIKKNIVNKTKEEI